MGVIVCIATLASLVFSLGLFTSLLVAAGPPPPPPPALGGGGPCAPLQRLCVLLTGTPLLGEPAAAARPGTPSMTAPVIRVGASGGGGAATVMQAVEIGGGGGVIEMRDLDGAAKERTAAGPTQPMAPVMASVMVAAGDDDDPARRKAAQHSSVSL